MVWQCVGGDDEDDMDVDMVVGELVVIDGEVVEVVEEMEVDGVDGELQVVEGLFIFMVIFNGVVKCIELVKFVKLCSNGLIVVCLQEGEYLVNVVIIQGDEDVVLVVGNGKVVCFQEFKVWVMGCIVCGVCGMKVVEGEEVIVLMVLQEGGQMLVVFENGYGKCIDLSEFFIKGWGIQGVIGMVVNECNGLLVGVVQVFGNEDIMLIFNQGILVCICVDEVSYLGCNIQGVCLICLGNGEVLFGLVLILELDVDDDELEEGVGEENGVDGVDNVLVDGGEE